MSEKKFPARYTEAGWLLGLHYMAGDGVEVERPDPLLKKLQGKPWLYCGDELLGTPAWRERVLEWQDAVETFVLWVSDCRLTDKPGARITRESLRETLDRTGFECLEDDLVGGRAFLVYRKTGAPGFVYRPWRKAARHCMVVRGGAFGDGLMASSVLPALKAEGWTIDLVCNEGVEEVLRHDPHVDRFVLGRKGQIVDANIGAYWEALGARYDRVVNLSYSVEHTLLKRPWDGAFHWPHAQRKRLCAGSYLANQHALAEVPGPYRAKFYATPEEDAHAAKIADSLGPFVLWALRGSAVHKWYPFAGQVVTRLLAATGLQVVLSGGPEAAELEAAILDAAIDYLGAATAKRVHSMVGTGPIRRVLALAPKAALVIGPETGVLNAVGQERVPKVCLLSHSAPSNLTDDWVNAFPVIPSSPCWPCHRLHHGHQHCPQDPATTAAACQASITPDQVWDAINEGLSLAQEGELVAKPPEEAASPEAAHEFLAPPEKLNGTHPRPAS